MLPAFLVSEADHSAADVAAGVTLTGYFLARHVFEPRGIAIPEARTALIATVARGAIAA